mmetsp:Transcript_9575/g.21748  ORF Transcript_9575/g.21748 Transcript_9575/m.21748 type:complete len:167 (-) Transcript_9575:876-1376(-)
MEWFSKQQQEKQKTPQTVESAAPTRSSTGGMQRDTGAAGRCADWVQKLVNQVRPQLELSCSSGEAAVRAPDEEAVSHDRTHAQGTEASARLEESLAVKRLPTRGGAGAGGRQEVNPVLRYKRACCKSSGRREDEQDRREFAVSSSSLSRLRRPLHRVPCILTCLLP